MVTESTYNLFDKKRKMDEIFEHFHKVFEDMTFSGFFTPKFRNQSPRDEMLRRPENESNYSQVPEPWMPFPFHGDLVKPDMMDREMFNETLRQIDPPGFKKGDIIIDGQPANAPYAEKRDSSVRRWVSSFTSKTLIVNNSEVKELQKRVVREPDGTEVHTTIERSSDGEKKHVVYMRPDDQQSQAEDSKDLLIMDPSVPSMKEYQSENKSSGIFDTLRRWYNGN